jgi:hypothetical protein
MNLIDLLKQLAKNIFDKYYPWSGYIATALALVMAIVTNQADLVLFNPEALFTTLVSIVLGFFGIQNTINGVKAKEVKPLLDKVVKLEVSNEQLVNEGNQIKAYLNNRVGPVVDMIVNQMQAKSTGDAENVDSEEVTIDQPKTDK